MIMKTLQFLSVGYGIPVFGGNLFCLNVTIVTACVALLLSDK